MGLGVSGAGRTRSSNRTIDTRDDAPDRIVWGVFWFTETTPRAKCLGKLCRSKEDAEMYAASVSERTVVESWVVG